MINCKIFIRTVRRFSHGMGVRCYISVKEI